MTHSLRSRLFLAFAAMVALTLAVGVTSFVVHRRVQTQVSALRPASGVDLRSADLTSMGLEVEGYWDPSGGFVATEIEVIPGLRRPKVRGTVLEVDRARRTIQVFGVPIHLLDDTEVTDSDAPEVALAALRPGHRVEVTCDVEDGRWLARKVSTRDVKASDKIKGTPTSLEVGGDGAPDRLEFHGLAVSLSFDDDVALESGLEHVRRATHLMLALHECRAAAHELAGAGVAAGTGRAVDPDEDTRILAIGEERLDRARRDLVHYLGPGQPSDSQGPIPNRRLRALVERLPGLVERVDTLSALARSDERAAETYVRQEFDPFLEHELMPHVYAYLTQSEDDLGDELRALSSRTATTTQVALASSGVAALVALVLGFLVWRSIHRPIVALHQAAKRLGRGQLDTRVEVASQDELGDLAHAFNRMASDLASSTVSIDNLENVFDSMAGALILLDPDRRITNINRAATGLLGYERGDLLGEPFDRICPTDEDAASLAAEVCSSERIVAVSERRFRRRDQTVVPVSFSAAELRLGDGTQLGYVCVAQDLTERKRIEEQVRSSLAEKELLLREVHHRVKNNMQVISSMLAMQSSHSTDPRVIEGFEQSQARIRSMALIHEQLYQSSDLAHIDVRVYLELLTGHLRRSYGMESSVTIVLRLDELDLDLDQSLACGLIVNELVSNAYRHAFTEGGTGTIRVGLEEADEDLVLLHVQDDGGGLAGPLVPERSATLGMSLVATLARQLGGEVSIDGRAGVKVSVVFPRALARRAVG